MWQPGPASPATVAALPSGGGFGCGMRVFSVAGGADPGRGAERLSERFLSRGDGRLRKSGFVSVF